MALSRIVKQANVSAADHSAPEPEATARSQPITSASCNLWRVPYTLLRRHVLLMSSDATALGT